MADRCVDACRNHGHAHCAVHVRVEGRTNDDVCVGIDFLADFVRSFVEFEEGQVVATSDVDQNTTCAFEADFVEKRVRNRLLCRIDGAVFASCFTSAHHRFAHFVHHRTNVSKVEVDQARTNHQVGHAFNALIQNVVSHCEGFGKGGFFGRQTEQVLVRNDDQRINNLLQSFDACFRLFHALAAFELERLGHNANGQNAQLTSRLRDDRCRASARAAAHTSGDKAHVCASQMVNDLLDAFFSRSRANRRTSTSAQTFGDFQTHLDLRCRFRLLQSLRVGVRNNELHTLKFFFDHVIDRIAACTANAKYGNPGLELFLPGHGKVQCHTLSACMFWGPSQTGHSSTD